MICSLSTTFFYQNCSQVEQNSMSVSQVEYLPLFTNEVQLFEQTSSSKSCRKVHEVLFSQNHNLCFEVNDSCVYSQLVTNGFKPVDLNLNKKAKLTQESSVKSLTENQDSRDLAAFEDTESIEDEPDLKALVEGCQIFVDINDLQPVDFLEVTPNSVGYTQSSNACGMAMESLVNFKNRTCSLATDTCQSGFLKKNGFVKDYYSLCPQVL